MTLSEFQQLVTSIADDGEKLIDAATTASSLEEARTALLGRKSGRLPELFRQLPSLAPGELREAGSLINAVKAKLETHLEDRRRQLDAASTSRREIDLTMPARRQWLGSRHPVTLVIEEIEDIFRELGFTIALGPEAETEWYNFTALNFPADHPALDLHDTLYLGDSVMLRTHTSPVQIRTMQNFKPPIRILSPGNAYRRDFFDASHAPMFAQIEGLAVDEGVSFVDLKATLIYFANRFFGQTKTRFRPSYFPFTEPSAEMDVECQLCHGSGCASCKGTGWMEILGSGMVHPSVITAAGLDADRYTGWAFGMGPARIAMLRYDIPDIRVLYDSDVRFLYQIAR
ncbi:MAG TPA: phenylalanine--tRNA ligase subunit alpha [Gemmatimonadaceae bacterium]|nr:phenylalanine--tRNA ligase subunit alpha [Gemmatimonadaceae bacterium]